MPGLIGKKIGMTSVFGAMEKIFHAPLLRLVRVLLRSSVR